MMMGRFSCYSYYCTYIVCNSKDRMEYRLYKFETNFPNIQEIDGREFEYDDDDESCY